MNLEAIQNKTGVSSLEIAEITGKRHADVMRDIREQFEKLQIGQRSFASSYINEQNKEQPCFILDQEQLLILASGYDVVLRSKIIKRWFALEQKEQVAPIAVNICEAVPILKAYKEAAEIFGLTGNPALISANVATRRDTGIDIQEKLGITLLSENNERILTPTEIGQKIGLSARAVNTLLVEKLYQYKQGKNYYPTEQGEPFAVLIDTGKKNSSGAMIQQLKWKETIIYNIQNS